MRFQHFELVLDLTTWYPSNFFFLVWQLAYTKFYYFASNYCLFPCVCLEFQEIGTALLPVPVISKALPAPEEASPAPTAADTGVKAEAAPEPKVEAAAEPAPEINSVPKAEVKKESFPGISKSLSPFPYVNSSLYLLLKFLIFGFIIFMFASFVDKLNKPCIVLFRFLIAVSRFQASNISAPIPTLKTRLYYISLSFYNSMPFVQIFPSYAISCATYAPVTVLPETFKAIFLW